MSGNRFVVGNPARDCYFYGRESDIEMILAQPWNWLCGQRRMGKTSLLFRLQAEAERRGWIPLFFSLAHLKPEAASGRTLFDKFVLSCRRQLRECEAAVDDLSRWEPEEAFGELLSRALQSPRLSRGGRVLLLWDEAERLIDVEEHDPGFLERLRAALEAQEDVGFTIAGTQLLSGLFGRQSHCSPFLTAFRWRPIGPLDEVEAHALLRAERTGGWAKPPGDRIVEQMVAWSGGHPYVLQEAGFQLEERSRRELPPFEIEEWQSAIGGNQLIGDSFRDDFAKLTITQQEILSALCKSNRPLSLDELCHITDRVPDQIQEACDFLNNYGYVRKRGAYELRFQFYRRFAISATSTADSKKVSRIARTTVFISYSHADAEWVQQIRKFLRPAVTAGEIDEWSDLKIRPGSLWREEIERALESARIGVLLVSQDFIDSAFIGNVELPTLLKRASQGKCKVLCVHVRHSSLGGTLPSGARQLQELSAFQALNSPSHPLSALPESSLEAELVRIATEVANACAESL